jgi:carbamoyltransferase
MPVHALTSCLTTAGLTVDELSAVAYFEKPLNVLGRQFTGQRAQGPRGLLSFARDMPTSLGAQLGVGRRVQTMLRSVGATADVPVRYLDHQRSHAAAAYYPSPFDHAAVLVVDGIGQWATASVGRGDDHSLQVLDELRYPDSVGAVVAFLTGYLGSEPGRDEWDVMALSAYGKATYLDALRDLALVLADGSIDVAAARLGWYDQSGNRRRELHQLLGGPPRQPAAELTQRDADLAASVQHLLEEAVVTTVRHVHDVTGVQDLCMAGDVARNCVANGRILWTTPFDRLWVNPAPGDVGSAVGAALELWHGVDGHHRKVVVPDGMSGSFLGPRALPAEVDSWVELGDLGAQRFDSDDELAAEVARRLAAGSLVGWFGGRMEFGPHTLGHRAVLADPRRTDVRRRLDGGPTGYDELVPLTAAVLADQAREWFKVHGVSPYLSQAADVELSRLVAYGAEPEGLRERARLNRSEIPAVTHVDGTAYVQTVDQMRNPELHRLLAAFHEQTECAVLATFPLALAGEPVAVSPEDALRVAKDAGLDVLVVERHLFVLTDVIDLSGLSAPEGGSGG